MSYRPWTVDDLATTLLNTLVEVVATPRWRTEGRSSVTISANGQLGTYAPAEDYVGPDTFQYTACEKKVGQVVVCYTTTVAIDVMAAVDDVVAIPRNEPVDVPDLENDMGVDLVVIDNIDPTNGVVTVADGVTIHPRRGLHGPEFLPVNGVRDTAGTPMEQPVILPVP